MTIAVLWAEDGFLWCAADTRIVAGKDDKPTTELASKIYSITVAASAVNPSLPPERFGTDRRQAHIRAEYGFAYSGAAQPALQTAITASTFLQNLVRPGDLWNPPTFEDIAECVCRLASRFMKDRRQFGAEGLFQAAFFGWCPYTNSYKVAHIDGRDDGGSFRVELNYPARPHVDGDPWLILGSGTKAFSTALSSYGHTNPQTTKRIPLRVIDWMVTEQHDRTVGGATSIGAAYQDDFNLFYASEPSVAGKPSPRRIFNGIDLDAEVGNVGQYVVAAIGIA